MLWPHSAIGEVSRCAAVTDRGAGCACALRAGHAFGEHEGGQRDKNVGTAVRRGHRWRPPENAYDASQHHTFGGRPSFQSRAGWGQSGVRP